MITSSTSAAPRYYSDSEKKNLNNTDTTLEKTQKARQENWAIRTQNQSLLPPKTDTLDLTNNRAKPLNFEPWNGDLGVKISEIPRLSPQQRTTLDNQRRGLGWANTALKQALESMPADLASLAQMTARQRQQQPERIEKVVTTLNTALARIRDEVAQHTGLPKESIPATVDELKAMSTQLSALGIKPAPTIGVFMHSAGINGANNCAQYNIEHFHNQGLNVIASLPKSGPMQDQLAGKGIYVDVCPRTTTKINPFASSTEQAHTRAQNQSITERLLHTLGKCDYALTNCTMSTPLIPLLEAKGIPTLAVIHESWPKDSNKLVDFFKKTFGFSANPELMRRMLENSHGIISVAQTEADNQKSGLPAHEHPMVRTIVNGIARMKIDRLLDPESPEHVSKQQARQMFGIDPDASLMVSAGTVYPRKSPMTFVQGLAEMIDKHNKGELLNQETGGTQAVGKPAGIMAGVRYTNASEVNEVLKVMRCAKDNGLRTNIDWNNLRDLSFTLPNERTGQLERKTFKVPTIIMPFNSDGTANPAYAAGAPYDFALLEVTDKIPEMNIAADIHAQASNSEVLSLGLQEAMATGKPIIASDAGGTAEEVKGSYDMQTNAQGKRQVVPKPVTDQQGQVLPQTGFIIGKADQAGMNHCLEYLMTHPQQAKQFGDNGRALLESNFDFDTMNQAYYDEVKQLPHPQDAIAQTLKLLPRT